MLPERNVKSSLTLVAGKYAAPPNTVFVPRSVARFKVEVSVRMHVAETAVVASLDRLHSHAWSVLDANLKPVMHGMVKHSVKVGKRDPNVAMTVMAGAENPDNFDLVFSSAKLKNGATYTLVCKSYGVISMLDFVAVNHPKSATRRKPARKKKAKKKLVKRKVTRKKLAKRKAARKKAA